MRDVRIITTAFGIGLEDRAAYYDKLWKDNGFNPTYCDVEEIYKNGGKGIDALVVGVEKFNKELIDLCPDLKVAHKFGVGLDNFDISYAESKGIKVMNMPGCNSSSVAELSIALMLDLSRRLTAQNNTFKGGQFIQQCAHNVVGKTVGIVGTGSIGCMVAEYMSGFKMNYLGYDPFENPKAKALGIKYVSIEELLQKSDFVTIHVPLMESTYHLINRERIALMKDDAIVINASRGGIVDDVALAEAVASGKLYGAGLDVYEGESHVLNPILAKEENIISTPHIASYCHETLRDMEVRLISNLYTFFEGQN